MPNPQKQKGFTIVETLVAITILMIAIAGPLSIASKGLTAAIASRDQMIATYLAQESVEMIKNVRDNNIAGGGSWLNGFSGCTPSSHCDVSYLDSPQIATGATTYALKLTTANYYSHGNSGAGTPFSRYFYLTQSSGSGTCGSGDAQCLLVAMVTWMEGSVPYQVSLSTQIINSSR